MTSSNPEHENFERMERLSQENLLNAMDMDDVERPIGSPLDPAAEFARKQAELNETMVQTFGNIASHLGQIDQRFTNLETDVASLKEDVLGLKNGQARMSGHISHLMGTDYEAKAIEQSRRLIRRFNDMERATLVYASSIPSPTFEVEILIPAIQKGQITRQEADQLEDTDCIIRLEDPTKETFQALVEISMTVQNSDRARAAHRSQICSRATGVTTLAYVVGQQQDPADENTPQATFVPYVDEPSGER